MKNVLILEDLPDVRTWLVGLVKQSLAPENVYCAENLNTAKTLIKAHQFSLALIDIGLPDGSGLDALKLLSEKDDGCVKVITTIFDDGDTLFSALKQGADGYILKSEGSDELLEHLQGILVGKPPLSPSIAKKVLTTFRPEKSITVKLSPREEQVLTLIAKGYSIPSTAKLLNISQYTAADYLKQVYKKLHINNRADATMKAHELGFISHSHPFSV